MKLIEQHRWRVLWVGKWKTTSFHCTLEDILIDHPEAECVPGTLRLLRIPETPEEIRTQEAAVSTGWADTSRTGV